MKVYVIEEYHYGGSFFIGMTANKEEAMEVLKQCHANNCPCIKVYDLSEGKWVDFEEDYEDCIYWND
jgi:hypothetical protein